MLRPNVDVHRHYTYQDKPGTILMERYGLRVCPGGPARKLGDIGLAICPVCGDTVADFKARA